MRGVDEGAELFSRPQMGIGAREIGNPIAVIGRRLLARPALHGLVLEDRRQPDGGHAKALDVVQLRRESGQVAAMIEAARGGVEAMIQPIARYPAAVIGRIRILEAIRHHKIDDFIGW